MSIINTPAVVLRRINHSETSLIVTFYTRDYGRLTAIAKGARRPKSQFAGLLDLMNYLQIVVYTKESREIQTLSSAEYIKPFLRLNQDMDRTYLGMAMMETIRQAIIGEEPHPEVFDLLTLSLGTLNSDMKAGIEILWWFHLHLVSFLGFQPQFDRCYECQDNLAEGFFSADTGQMHCRKCVIHQPGMIELKNLELRLLKYLIRTSLSNIDTEAIQTTLPTSLQQRRGEKTIRPEIITDIIVKYLRYHVEGIGALQSLKFFTTFNLDQID